MLRTLLHKTLLTAIAILLGGWAVVAQQNVVKGTALSFKVDDNPTVDYRWVIYNVDAGTTANLTSNTHISEEYTFNIAGNFEVRVYPVDRISRCLGEPLTLPVTVNGDPPTITFDDLSTPYVCSANNGVNPRAEISCTVNYKGPLPWTFKYSVDREPAVLPPGADEIWTSSFDFVVTIRNESGLKSRSEIMIVEAKSLSGLEVVENIDAHRVEIDVLGLPDTKFTDYEPSVMAGTLYSYKANILRHDPDITPSSPASSKRYEILVPDGATVLNESTRLLADELHSELSFDIQWGEELGPKQIKLIEKNAFNCYGDTIYANINVIETFMVDLGADKNVCKGDEITLTPSIDMEGNFKYLWSTGETTESIQVSTAGTYTLTVTETNLNKTSVASVKVNLLDLPVVDLGDDYELADGEVKTLDAGAEGTYLWSNGETTKTIDVDRSGLYFVTVTGVNGCQATDEINITSVNDVFAIELGDDIVACVNDAVVLNPNPSITQNYKFKWSTGEETQTISVNESKTYSVVVTDDAGNVKRDEVTVVFNALPIVDLGADRNIYEDESLTLDAGNAGTGATYLWSTGETTQTIEITNAGIYSVTVTNSNGCSNTDEVKVIENKGQKFTVDLGDEIEICEGDSAFIEPTIDRDIDPTYKWIPGEATDKGIYVDKKGKYCVEVSDAFGNKETACVDVLINPSPKVDLGIDRSLEVGETAVLDAGNDGIAYLWSTNETTSTIEVSTTGEYSVIVTNSKGCNGSDAVNIQSKGRRFLPSGFSPNGDGNNDVLKVKGADIKNVTFIIYNRGGRKIFQSNRVDIGWDGTYKGELQRMDTYVYFLKVTLDDNSTEIQRGEVTLLN
ncbi:gliding motility-associated C-terminal domain-containing protein [Ancylomarina salipaludis]|uniref:Gliding motility-associated C-terminal domain-containing protein n=1 Tax=Ancylomarina salipaludis TaxID=2501299 RepID=A0A4Q1JQI8_9BACT|nr:gliding motility-associated C-terminal domain-containing protein [Ancylomarina salipaludis]RXQ97724.1 gliding motility-associated C-terminal domain-containing protein [Ancylomarina salipaludis]